MAELASIRREHVHQSVKEYDAAHQLGGSLGLGILVTVSAAAGSTTLDAAHLLADRVATALAAGTGMLALALPLIVVVAAA